MDIHKINSTGHQLAGLSLPPESPLPLSSLDTETLGAFLPLIMQELEGVASEQDDARTHRKTIEYGYSFFKMEHNDFEYTPPPPFLQEIGDKVCVALGHQPTKFTNIILSIYERGFHLEPHADVSEKDRYGDAQFYFGENVYGLVVEADPEGHLYFVKWDDGIKPPLGLEKIYELDEKTGSVFCLQGPFRTSPYFHGVSEVSNRRISLTFREVVMSN